MILFYSPALAGNHITNMLLRFETTGCFLTNKPNTDQLIFFFFNNMKIYVSKQRIVPKSDNTQFNLLLFVYTMTKVNNSYQYTIYFQQMVHIPKSCAMAGIGIEGEKATPGVSSVIIMIKTFLDQSDSPPTIENYNQYLVLFQKFILLFFRE